MSNTTDSNFWLTARTNARLKHQFPSFQIAPRHGKYSLSLQQERLWSLEQLQPNTSVYNLLHTIRFAGSLNLAALEQSLHEITQRHEILRTTFLCLEGEAFQSIGTTNFLELSVVDLRQLPLEQQETRAKKLALEEAEQPFDYLASEPLWRFKLLRLAEDDYRLIRTIHHLIFDGWSHSVFLRELGALYEAFSAGKPSPLPDPSLQYVDFAYTQRQWVQDRAFANQLDYWKQQLGGQVSSLDLPTDYPHLSFPTYQGDCQSLVFSEELTKALKTLIYQQGVSLFATLLTAFKILLYGYSKQEDMMVCSPVAGRHRPETKNLIGYFNNVVVIRTDLSDNPSFCELLAQVSQVALNAYANQDVPLQKLAEFPHLASTSLTRAMFVLQNTPNQTFNFEGLTVTSQYVERPIANFDLSLSMEEKEGKLTGALQYKTDLFEPNSITQMLENFQTLLESIVANPEQPISLLSSLMTGREFSPSQAPNQIKPKQQETYIAPRNELEVKLTKIWENVLGIEPIGVKDNFFTLGGYSLTTVRLFAQIEQEFGKKFPLTTLLQAPTLEQLATLLDPSQPQVVQESLILLQDGGAYPPLFLIHDGDGETLLYLNLAQCLQPKRPVYGIQPYNQQGYPMMHTRIPEMAVDYLEQIRSIQPEGPYLLGGLCAGGVIAFEIARQLQSQGQKVDLVALIDAADVEAPKRFGYTSNQRMSRFTKALLGKGQPTNSQKQILDTLNTAIKKVNNLIAYELRTRMQESWDNLKMRLFRYYLDRGLLPPKFLQNIPVRTVYLFSEREYSPQGLFTGEVTLFCASQGEGDDEPYINIYGDPLLGWGNRTTGGVKVYNIPGGHSSMLQPPNVQIMADAIQDYLNSHKRLSRANAHKT
jgi:thioesterase domain-containing protein/acyl carrier protein